MVLRFYTTPPMYDYTIFEYYEPRRLMKAALILHGVAVRPIAPACLLRVFHSYTDCQLQGSLLYAFVGGNHPTSILRLEMMKPHAVLFWASLCGLCVVYAGGSLMGCWKAPNS